MKWMAFILLLHWPRLLGSSWLVNCADVRLKNCFRGRKLRHWPRRVSLWTSFDIWMKNGFSLQFTHSHCFVHSLSLSLSLSLTYLSLSLFVSYSLCFYTHCLFMPLCHSQRFLLLFWSATLNISISHYWTISFYVYFSLVLFICVSYLLSMSLILYLYLLPTLCVFVPVSFTFSPSHSSDVLSSSESCKNLRNVISCHAVAF